MSKATKKKYVTQEVLDEYVLPDNEKKVVKVLASRGNNLHEVETCQGVKFLVSMPTKFRRNVWIKRGDFVLVTPIEEGDKVKAEISNILYKDQIKYIQEEGLWPKEFTEENVTKESGIPADMLPPSDDSGSESDNDELLTANPNRPKVQFVESEGSESSEEEEEEGQDN